MNRFGQRHDVGARGFASDNASGMHPAVVEALALANGGHVSGYGADPYTAALAEVVRRHFGAQAEVFPVLTGTGANVTALQAVTARWESVLCSDVAHVLHDEGGGLEHVGGTKLVPVTSRDGLVDPGSLGAAVRAADHPMRAPVGAVTLTQTTELGTTYSLDHLREVTTAAHRLGLRVHLDGARLANAAVHLGVGLGEVTTELGVDVVSLGGTKNGGGFAEAIVVCTPGSAPGLARLRKQSLQLLSKGRFLAAQLLALFEGEVWRENATAANAAATRLADGAQALQGARVTRPVQANTVFAELPRAVAERAAARIPFYVWDPEFTPATVEVRWVASFDTGPGDVEALLAVVAEELAAEGLPTGGQRPADVVDVQA